MASSGDLSECSENRIRDSEIQNHPMVAYPGVLRTFGGTTGSVGKVGMYCIP